MTSIPRTHGSHTQTKQAMDTSSCSFAEPCSQDQPACTNTPRKCAQVSTPSNTPLHSKSRTPKTPCKTPTTVCTTKLINTRILLQNMVLTMFQGDRFIPAREEDLDIAHFYVTQSAASTSICTDSGNYASVLADSIFEGRTQSKVSNVITRFNE